MAIRTFTIRFDNKFDKQLMQDAFRYIIFSLRSGGPARRTRSTKVVQEALTQIVSMEYMGAEDDYIIVGKSKVEANPLKWAPLDLCEYFTDKLNPIMYRSLVFTDEYMEENAKRFVEEMTPEYLLHTDLEERMRIFNRNYDGPVKAYLYEPSWGGREIFINGGIEYTGTVDWRNWILADAYDEEYPESTDESEDETPSPTTVMEVDDFMPLYKLKL